MYRNPILDLYAGAMLALGGPLALMLPQRIFLEMLSSTHASGRSKPVTKVNDLA